MWITGRRKDIAVHLPYTYSLLCLGVDHLCERELWSDPIQLLSWQVRYLDMFTQDEQKFCCSTCLILQLLEHYCLHSLSWHDELKTTAESCSEWCCTPFRLEKEIKKPGLTEDSKFKGTGTDGH